MLTELQKKAAQAIVNIFETDKAQGEYGKVTLLQNDSGHLTYGRSQTTLASGNLHLLIKDYCEAAGAQFASALGMYLERLARRDTSLDNDISLRGLLREAGEDPIMQEVQDQFFDRVYWLPSVRDAEAIGISTGLGTGVVYDSYVHSGPYWRHIRDRTNDRHGVTNGIGELTWISHYVNERRDWLSNHSNTLLHRTVYRMNAFRQLIGEEKWGLELPFRVRSVVIDEDILMSPVRVSAHDDEERTLLLQAPYMRGDDVRAVQQALADAGFAISLDGIFGPDTEAVVRELQQRQGLKVDGIVGRATRSALGL